MDYTRIVRDYLVNGYNCLPLQVDGSKKPIGSWSHLQDRQLTEHELQTYWGNGQPAGIGILAGHISQNLHILDFDAEADEHFRRFWNDAQQLLPGIADKLIVVATPRPGRQVWFRQESAPPKSQQLALSEPQPTGEHDADGNEILLPGILIETRGSGSYAVAVGSPAAVHPTGKPYQLIHGTFEQLPVLADAEADALLDICRSYSRYTPEHVQNKPGERYSGEPRPGDIYNQSADIRQLLLDAGWKSHHWEQDVEYLTRPGKAPAEGYSATLGFVRTDDGQPVLIVHSAAAAPFQKGSGYDAFACYALLKHGGDFGTAAAAVKIHLAGKVEAAQQQYHQAQQQSEQEYKPFPAHLLPDVVQQYVAEHAAAIGIDDAYVAVPMLPVLAALIGQSRAIYIKRNFTLPSILWAVTIGDVSRGKTPGWEAATAPADSIEHSLHQLMKQADAEHLKQLEAFERGELTTKPKKEKQSQQLVVNDFTMETLIDIHQYNNRLLLSIDELAAWVRSMDQYRGGKGRDVENWLSIYNGGKIQVNRKTDGYRVYLPQTSISVCGTIQPTVAQETIFTERFIGNGFAARILCAYPPGPIVGWTDAEVPQQVDDAMHELAQQLYGLQGDAHGMGTRPKYLPLAADALQIFKQWMQDAADYVSDMDRDLQNAWLKLRPVAARLALVHSVVQQTVQHPEAQASQPVDAQSMQAGIELAWWFGHELERNYSTTAGPDELQKHFQWILTKHPNGVDTRTLLTGRWSIKTAADARLVIQQLLEQGFGRLDGKTFIPHK